MGEFANLRIPPDMVEMIALEFGEWLPDMPPMNNPGAVEALNVIPSEKSYVPFRSLSPIDGKTMPFPVRGAFAAYTDETHLNVYAGMYNGIFADDNGFNRLYSSPISLSEDYAWQFSRFGESLVAIHPQIPPVAANVGGATPFSPLGGSPPTAATGARIRDFLVLGNLTHDPDSGTADPYPSRIRWSGFNNIDSPWVTDPATQADYQDLPTEGGPVVALIGRETGTIFQARSISRMTYEGLPNVFSIDTVEENRGAISRDSVVDIGAFVFYIAEEGFFIWNGTNSTPIGDNKVNKYFFNRLNYAARSRIVGAIDYINKCVMWAFPTDDSYLLTEIIVYSWKENRWSHTIQTLEYLFSSGIPNYNLDTLTGNLDTDYSVSFDALEYNGGGHAALAGFNTDHEYGFFNGANLAVTLDTAESSGPDGRRVFSNSVRPLVDLSLPVATISVAQRDQMFGEAVVFSAPSAQEITGECPVTVDARLARFRLSIPQNADWRNAQGLEVWRKASGRV